MNCRKARARLVDGQTSGTVETHVAGCAGCRAFASDLGAVREGLRRHHAGATPDPSFAGRVSSRLRTNEPVELLGWAAMRLLPLSLIAALILGWMVWDRSSTVADPGLQVAVESSDPLTWLFEDDGGTQ